jgi:hypothetical protein
MLSVVPDDAAQAALRLELDELFREGARRMLAVALEAEVEAYIAAHAELLDEHGHRLVVRNGHAPARTITTGVGQVEVVRPRVDDEDSTAPAVPVACGPGLSGRWCRRSCHRLLGRVLPEICQKLRHAQLHPAPQPNLRQRLSPVALCGNVRCYGVL